jgi:hypothetical protein
VELLAASGEQLVDVGLMADIENKMVFGSIEDIVHGDGQFHHAEIWTQMAAVLGENGNQLFANFPS